MRIFGRMLSRMILSRFTIILLGITLLVITLEVIANLESILAGAINAQAAVLRYIMLRLPGLLATFFSMSLLLATVLSFVELGYRNEIAPIWAAGVTPARLLLMLLPLGAILGVGQFMLSDRLVPATVQQLIQWGIGDFERNKLQAGGRNIIWMRAGNDILRAEKANRNTTLLKNLTIFRRDRQGLLTEQIFARQAKRTGKRWQLEGVTIYRREPVPPTRIPVMIYSGELKLAAEGMRSGNPEVMTLPELQYFIENLGFGLRPVHVYEVQLHHRLTLFFLPLLLIAICIPLATRFRRHGITGSLLLMGVAVGFGFFLFDGLAQTLGEIGLVPPWLAGWLPAASLALLALALYLRAETVQ